MFLFRAHINYDAQTSLEQEREKQGVKHQELIQRMSNCLIECYQYMSHTPHGYTILRPKSKMAIMLTPVFPISEIAVIALKNTQWQKLSTGLFPCSLPQLFLAGKQHDSQGCNANLSLRDEYLRKQKQRIYLGFDGSMSLDKNSGIYETGWVRLMLEGRCQNHGEVEVEDYDWEYVIIIVMISQQLIRQVIKEEDNDRVYKIQLCSRSITRICGLKPFSKLRSLQLSFNRIHCIENLDCLPDLRELRLDYNQITTLCGLDTNKMLTLLTLTSNRIDKIQNIGHLIKLETLVIDNNRIEKISGLETLKDLKYLSLSHNRLVSIDSLPSFSKLQTLIADSNQLKKISQSIFAKSVKLIKLSLADNQIEEVGFIGALASLEELNLSHNNINDFAVGPLKNLEYLNVCGNKISSLPRLSLLFPQLSVFLFAHNEVTSQFEIIQSLAEADMLVQIDYRGNFMDNPQFADTLYRIYGFDRINQKNYNKPGTRYLNQAHEIKKFLQEQGMGEIQNDEDVRKIIMSGFYDQDLETDMTGVKPDRPNPSSKNRVSSTFGFDEMEKSFHEIVKNQKRLEYLRSQCRHIFESNNIKVDFLASAKREQDRKEENNNGLITEVKNLVDKTSSMNTVSELVNKNQENANKWKQLKNREKSFNIRGVVRKVSGSQQKSGTSTTIKQGSLSKIVSSQERSELMKTQLNPPRWNNDPALTKTMQARPFSARKKEK